LQLNIAMCDKTRLLSASFLQFEIIISCQNVTVRDFGNAISVVKLMHKQAAAENSSLSCHYTVRRAHVSHPVLCGTRALDNKALYRVIKKSLCTWWLYCNRQMHRDFLIALYFGL